MYYLCVYLCSLVVVVAFICHGKVVKSTLVQMHLYIVFICLYIIVITVQAQDQVYSTKQKENSICF